MNTAVASEVFGLCDRELWLVTARAGERSSGLIATYVSNASLVPVLPRVIIGLAKHHYTSELVQMSERFCLHLFDEAHIDWVWRFGMATGRELNKFEGLAIETGVTGAPILADALAWLDCRIESSFDCGDRTIHLAEVLEARVVHANAPLTVKRMVELAPTEMLQRLGLAVQRDSELDRAAILEWRRQKR